MTVWAVCFLCIGGWIIFIKTMPQKLNKSIATGLPVENFVLIDHEGVFHELYNYSDQKAIVLVSQANGCSFNQQAAPYLNLLKKQYDSQDIAILMINASLRDDKDSIIKESQDYEMGIPVLIDSSQMISVGLEIRQAGEAFVIDPKDWTIVYRGAVEKRGRVGIKDVIDGLITEIPVAVTKTEVVGCEVDMHMGDTQKEITYVDDVGPILVGYCLPCHNEARNDTWAMNDYEMVVSYGQILKEVIRTKRMPPWQGDVSLSAGEIRTLVQWVEQGMPRGEGSDPLKSYLTY